MKRVTFFSETVHTINTTLEVRYTESEAVVKCEVECLL